MKNLICPGFMAAGVASGLKKAGEKDDVICSRNTFNKAIGVNVAGYTG